MEIRHISEKEFGTNVLDSDKPVLVDFFATWCGPCQMLAPVLENIAQENEDFYVVKVDIDENPGLAMEYGIMAVPTLMKFVGGKVAGKFEGFTNQDSIVEMMRA